MLSDGVADKCDLGSRGPQDYWQVAARSDKVKVERAIGHLSLVIMA